MFHLTTLASGSSGNCLLLSDGATHLLIDAGISARKICAALKAVSIDPATLAGVLITHEHTDHICGLATLTKQLAIPVYTSPGTGRQLCYRIAFLEPCLHTIAPGGSFSLGNLLVETFATPHDTAESMGFAVTCGAKKMAVVTDLGHVTDAVRAGVRGAQLLVAEANHDEDWVKSSPYPYFLKQRILGPSGHLSNEAGGALACSAAEGGAHTVLLAHLSAENNTPAHAYDAVSRSLTAAGVDPRRDLTLEVVPRAAPSRQYAI